MTCVQKTIKTIIFSFAIFLLAGLSCALFAADENPVIISNDETWSGDRSFTASLVPGANIGIEVNNSSVNATVTTDGNIDTHDNGWRGVSVNNGGKLTIKSDTPGNTLKSYNNGDVGILSLDQNSSMTVEDMNVVLDNNPDGVQSLYGAAVRFYSSDGSNTLNVTGNSGNGTGLKSSDDSGGTVSSIAVENMDVTVADHSTGIRAHNKATVSISSADGSNTLDISNNSDIGLQLTDSAVVNIDNMSTTINQNGNYGIRVSNGSQLNFTNSTDGNFLNITNNGSDGILAIDSNSSASFADLDITIENNSSKGALAQSGGKLSFSSSSGTNTLDIKNNGGNGTALSASDDGGGMVSSVEVKNMNVTLSEHSTGLQAHNKATVSVSSASGANTLNISDNSDIGLQVTDSGVMNIDNMSTTIENNGNYGIRVNNGSQLNFTNSTAGNYLKISGNGSDGILAIDNNSGSGVSSSASFADLDITIEDNASKGALALNGGKLSFSSSTGNNTLNIINNGNNGVGLSALDSGNGVNSSVDVQNMNVNIINYYTGLQASGGGTVSMSSASGGNILGILRNADLGVDINNSIINIDNMTATVSQNGNNGVQVINGGRLNFTNSTANNYLETTGNTGAGIFVKDNNSGVPSAVTIDNLTVFANYNSGYGINTQSAGKIYISNSAGYDLLLQTNNNKNAVSGWTSGAGIFAQGDSLGEVSEIIIENMDIEVKDNGQYGIVADGGGAVSITGNGSNEMLVSGNKAADTLGTGILASGSTNSIVDISAMNVTVTDNGSAGIFAKDGGTINITGNRNSLSASGNTNSVGNPWDYGRGIFAQGAGSGVNIGAMNIEVNNNGAYGISAADGGKIIIEGDGSHTLDLNGNALYGLFLKGVDSEMDISGMVISGAAASANDALIGLEVDGTYKFTNSIISTSTGNLFHAWGDDGKYVLTGSSATSDNGKLFTLDSNNAVVEAANSYLNGAIYTANTKTSTVTFTDSTWLMRESSNISNLTLAGDTTIDMHAASGYNTLTLSSLTSNNANYLLNTYFDITGTQTDKIIVDGGAATGADNFLHVTSTGYDGSYKTNGYGIQVVNLDNATNKSIGFYLLGGVVDSGAYEYELYQAADNNYYLQSTASATATARTIANIPAVHISIVKTGMNEMRKRLGELRTEDFDNKNGIWARAYAKHLKVDDTINSKMNLYGVEAGYDRALFNDGDSKVIAGIMAGYLYTDSIEHHNGSRYSGSSDAHTPSFGLYGTWFAKNGWFADATTRYFISKMDVDNYTAAGDLIDYDADRNFLTASLEVGKQFEYPLSAGRKIVFEPKVEAQYMHAPSESFTANNGNRIEYSKTQAFNTRAAIKLGYSYKTLKGIIYQPFIEAGLNHEFDGKTNIKYAMGDFKSDVSGTGFDIALGLHAALSENVALFGDIAYEKGYVYEGASGQIGIRFSFGDGKKTVAPQQAAVEEKAPVVEEEPVTAQPEQPVVVQKAAPEKIAATHYAFDKDDLSPSAKKSLDEVVLKIKDDTSVGVVLIGHTDSTGPEKYNQTLSERRAKKAYDYLVKSGIDESRIASVGKGELEPVASNATKDGRAQNRRVEIYIF
ncbi:outer membrane autotransporter protein [Elusimicrobium posterum]|uniref:autotransporter outer membrane beta-barrel domain-containing protein n=1 Tax=Elusimicrobium posterum TaxID=3116653 RepID=UPI003C71915D